MSSNLKVNTILPSTGTTIGIGTVGGLINVVGNIDVNSTSGISTFNGLEISGIVTAKAGAAVTYYGDGSNLTSLPAQATIANNADNRVITGGSGVNLNGEANLTFETSTTGGTLTVAGTSEYQLKLKDSNTSGNGAETALAFTDSGDTIQGFVGYNYWGDGNLDIQNNNSGGNVCINTGGGNERVVIDSVGAITVQSALAGNTALAFLRNTRTRASGNKYGIEFRDSVNEANANIVIQQNSSGNNAAEMKFYVNGGTGGNGLENGNHILRLKQSKDVEIPDGNLIIGTSGHGIDFSATSDASGSDASGQNELLDDYEQGDLTFTVTSSQGGSISYSYRTGHYTRVGNVCHVSGDIRFSGSWSGSDGDAYISLPFTSEQTGGCVGGGIVSEWNLTSSAYVGLMIKVDNNESFARVTAHDGGNNNTSSFQTDYLGSGRYLKFAFTYQCQ